MRFAGNLALISSTRPRTHLSLARVPEGLSHTIRQAKKRWLPNANNDISHANVISLAAVVRSRHATVSPTWERESCMTRQTNVCEGDYSVR